MTTRPLRAALVAGVTATAALVLAAGPALAHVEPDPGAIPAGEATTVSLTIEHGCDESPTTAVAIQVPEGLEAAAGVALNGWAIESSGGAVTWTADEPLPSDQEQAFALELTPATDQVGQTLELKTVQTCEEGELRWIEAWDGEGEEPEHPAPTVEVVAAGTDAAAAGDHHDDEAEGGEDHDEAGAAEDEGAAASSSGQDDADDGGDDDSEAGIVLVVLLIGAVGLGGVALVRSRRAAP